MSGVRLRAGADAALRAGFPWVYRNQIDKVDGRPVPGDAVEVLDQRGRFLGRGFYNPTSLLTVRVLTRDPAEELDDELLARRVQRAWDLRRKVLPDTECCRVVHAEADGLPGLIVDKYGPCLVLQVLSLGMDQRKAALVRAMSEILAPAVIYERSDAHVRELEGLPPAVGVLRGKLPERLTVRENGLDLVVDVAGGQKTGHFLDQRDNRALAAPLANGARVLDVFCHTGGFGLVAARAGAREVAFVDSSGPALELTRENAVQNGLADICRFKEANAFDELRALQAAKERFDLVILDPPAFAKSRAALEGALRGYKDVNLRGLKLLEPGGFLITCSCSHHLSPEMFQEVVAQAARDAGRRLQVLTMRGAPPDHPVLLAAPETAYLKCLVARVE